jgi:acidic leucine-rich nuclear phosphoprotein 32 family protein A/C/D
LSNNLISSILDLKPLDKLPNLTIFDMSNNPITQNENYRDEVFKILPKLEVLDRQYKGGQPQISDHEEEFDDMLEEQEELVGDDNEEQELDDDSEEDQNYKDDDIKNQENEENEGEEMRVPKRRRLL